MFQPPKSQYLDLPRILHCIYIYIYIYNTNTIKNKAGYLLMIRNHWVFITNGQMVSDNCFCFHSTSHKSAWQRCILQTLARSCGEVPKTWGKVLQNGRRHTFPSGSTAQLPWPKNVGESCFIIAGKMEHPKYVYQA